MISLLLLLLLQVVVTAARLRHLRVLHGILMVMAQMLLVLPLIVVYVALLVAKLMVRRIGTKLVLLLSLRRGGWLRSQGPATHLSRLLRHRR